MMGQSERDLPAEHQRTSEQEEFLTLKPITVTCLCSPSLSHSHIECLMCESVRVRPSSSFCAQFILRDLSIDP